MNTQLQLLILVLAIAVVILNIALANIDVMYERIEQISGSDLIDFSQIRVRKFNRTHAVLDGTINLLQQLDDSLEVGVRAAYSTLGNNQFVQYPMKLASQKVCEFCNTTWRDYQPYYQNSTNLPKIGECPITPKQFYIRNHIMNSEEFTPFLPRGLWRFRCSIIKAGAENNLAIIDFYIKIVDKGIF
ncbi:uncharacterized protein LOC128736577 [Sabethes cyaneus]|uniref:uncharacterized protein LOC128736577 n=1 Tax=Sabethes cyaneus TaxID=53552 RepID=UPI00237E7849|nr:uncharacterized protein LOC128736577 [Sabethes cyaneus]